MLTTKEKGRIPIKFSNLKIASMILLIIAMICFIFPFVRVSFWGFSVEASGFELATTISLHEDVEFSEEDSPDPFLIAGFLCGLFGLGIAWEAENSNRKLMLTGFFSIAGVVCLWLYRTAYLSEVDKSGYGGLASIIFGWGWTLSIIAYAGAGILAFIANNLRDKSTNAQFQKKSDYSFSSDGRIVYDDASILSSDVQKTEIKPQSAALLRVVIKCRQGSRVVQEWTPTEFPCFVGRDASVARIVVPDAQISKIHAKLFIEQGAVMVSDENSSNGTFVNGEKISFPVELLTGDEVRIGETTLFFEVSE